MKRRPGDFSWDKVTLLDEDWDDTNVGDVLDTNRSAPRRIGDYRRSNRYVEDGYGELDFA